MGEEDYVRMMMRVTMSIEAGNAMIKSGRLPVFMAETLGRLKPEAAYFTADKGDRTAYLFLDVKDQSDLPSLAEPFFMELGAKVEFMPAMNADDLKTGLSKVPGR
jgi:hypothetical protein